MYIHIYFHTYVDFSPFEINSQYDLLTQSFKMFSAVFCQEFSKTVKTANMFGFPLIWDTKTRKLQFSATIHPRTVMVKRYIFLHMFYLLGQTIRHKFVQNSNHFNFLLACCYAIMPMCVGTYLFSNQGKEVARNWNAMFLYSVKFYGMYV